jgi:DNA invertase Pin-like site-specific DNA recombinase
VLAEEATAGLRKAHRGFERARSRVWLRRIKAGLDYRRAIREIDEEVARERGERDRLIRETVAAGASYREVARALGLSHSRIQQIVNAGAAPSGRERSR